MASIPRIFGHNKCVTGHGQYSSPILATVLTRKQRETLLLDDILKNGSKTVLLSISVD